MWRRQLPAWSPISAGGLLAGAGAPSGIGRHTEWLTHALRTEYGAAAVQLTESGTVALALAMLAATPDGTRPSVALPAWGCYDLMTAADIVDAEVLLYDLDPATLEPDAASFASALARRPAAVVVAHWYGLPVPLAPLIAAARGAGTVFIEDAAQGVGGFIADRPLGSFGDFGVLSFGRGKGRTGGCGGALLANTGDAAGRMHRVESRVAAARPGKGGLIPLAAQWAFGRPWAYAIPSSIPALRLGQTVYHAAGPMRGMPEWAAAVVASSWSRAAIEGTVRRAAAARWASLLARHESVRSFAESPGSVAGWLRFPVLVNDARALLDADARRLGIMPGYEAILADLPVAPGRLGGIGPWPGAAKLAAQLRTLPTHSLLRLSDVRTIDRLLTRRELRRA
jgi:perosamine synthetase